MTYGLDARSNDKNDLQFYIDNGYWAGNAGISLVIAFQDRTLSQMTEKMGKKDDAAYYTPHVNSRTFSLCFPCVLCALCG